MKIVECPRDAMQGVNDFISTKDKIEYLNSLLKVGFHTLDFGSFVSPKSIPQMRDTIEVLKGLDLSQTKTKLLAIVANLRGAKEALYHSEIDFIGYPFSVSETFQLKNTNKGVKDSFELVKKIQKECTVKNKTLIVYLSMAFGNPYNDPWSLDLSINWIAKLKELGIKIVSIADTTSHARIDDIKMMFNLLKKGFSTVEFGLHLHTSELDWKHKLEAAFNSGCRRFDSVLGGYGGCPFAGDKLVGNLSTQNLISFLEAKDEIININKKYFEESIKISQKIFKN